MQNALIVLGMHRSGTSALAGVLSLLGADPGTSLLPAQEGVNPKGFWEHAELVAIHDKLLDAFGSSWDDISPLPDHWWRGPTADSFRAMLLEVLHHEFDTASLWLAKDPRLCRLLPLWLDLLDELGCHPHFLISLRNPADVAHSLGRRDNLAEPESCMLWLTYMLEAERLTRDKPRIFVSYDRLLADWRQIIEQVGTGFSLRWPVPVGAAAPAIDAFLDPALRHADDIALSSHPACRMAEEAFQALMNQNTDTRPILDRLQHQMLELEELVAPWSKCLSLLRRQTVQCEAQNILLQAEVARVKATLSWKITGPLRATWNLLRRKS